MWKTGEVLLFGLIGDVKGEDGYSDVNILAGSTITLHRPGTSAATGEKPQLSGQYIFSFKRGHLVMWVQPTNLLELPNIVSVVFVDNNIST